MTMTDVATYAPWLWLALAVLLLAAETMLPGFFLVWFGTAASVVGVSALLFPMSLPSQIGLFGLVAVITVIFARLAMGYGRNNGGADGFHDRGTSYVGRQFEVIEPIRNGRGRIKVADTVWSAEGADTAAGQQVTVVGVRGNTLLVEPVE